LSAKTSPAGGAAKAAGPASVPDERGRFGDFGGRYVPETLVYALDQLDEADAWARRAEELGSSDDADKEMLWRRVRAKVFARRGKHADGERLALEAVAIGDETDRLDAQGDAYADLAEVLLLAGRAEEAAAALERALERYERKGNIVSAQRARARLAELQDPAAR